MVGGTGNLTERAANHVENDRPLEALHLTDIVLAYAPTDCDALSVKRIALQQLLEASGRENHSEVQWLEQELGSTNREEDL